MKESLKIPNLERNAMNELFLTVLIGCFLLAGVACDEGIFRFGLDFRQHGNDSGSPAETANDHLICFNTEIYRDMLLMGFEYSIMNSDSGNMIYVDVTHTDFAPWF